MLEIVLVFVLCKKMGENMRSRGYEHPFWFQFFVPIFWFGGEFTGAFIFALIRALMGVHRRGGFDFRLYVAALAGAALATFVLFLGVNLFPRRPFR
jgi:hypothetical protein